MEMNEFVRVLRSAAICDSIAREVQRFIREGDVGMALNAVRRLEAAILGRADDITAAGSGPVREPRMAA